MAHSSRSRRSPTSDDQPEIVVRDAASGDARDIAHIHAATWRHAYAHIFTAEQLGTISVDESAARWRRIVQTAPARSHTLVAGLGGAIVGFASSGPNWSQEEADVSELYAIYVLPDAQGRGVGRELMAASVSRLRDDGFSEAILWVFEDNPRTRRFYELVGWVADGGAKDEPVFGTTAPAVRYRLALEPPA